jgi:hypothetical protein
MSGVSEGKAIAMEQDMFAGMVSARTEVNLPLGQFDPLSMVIAPDNTPSRSKFHSIDYHNHLDSQEPAEVLRVMDACGVEMVVNITMQVGEGAINSLRRFHNADAQRFATIAWMDWGGVERDDFVAVTLDRLDRMADLGAVGLKFWKDLGLSVRDGSGNLLRIDDDRLAPVFERAGERGLAVMFHTADPSAFFLPIDRRNERYEELAAHPEWGFSDVVFSKDELLRQRNTVFARHSNVQFVGAHAAESGEDLHRVRALLSAHPNVMIDISARASELGRQPYAARQLFLDFADRIVFGTDLLPEESMYRGYFRFLETADEYFPYPSHASRQGRWNIYGLFLPDDVLRKVYRDNALRLLDAVRGRR